MRVWCLVVGLVWVTSSASAGDKVAGEKTSGEKVLNLDAKGLEVKGDIKVDDPQIKFEFMGKIFLMPSQQFELKMAPGLRYRFTLDTSNPKFDPFLMIKDKKGETLIYDDDSGGKLNSMLTFFALGDTTYQLFVASLGGGPGPFVLKAAPVSKFHAEAKTHDVKKELILKGELTDARQEIHYQVKLKAGQAYRIDLSSERFDSFLELRDAAGRLVAEDDDTGGKRNARIQKTISDAGVYRVVVSSTNFAQTGPFVLEVREE